jgi:hypothetical protein
VNDFTADQREALDVAHRLVDMGVPLFVAKPNSLAPGEFHYPSAWQTWRPRHDVVDRWRPGDALCMVTGVVFDVIDIDPRNGGTKGFADLAKTLNWDVQGGPEPYGQAATPSEGEHILIGRTFLTKGQPARGVDLQAGDEHGEGRGFVFIAPTVRPSKWGARKGEPVAYRWTAAPDRAPDSAVDIGLAYFRDHILAAKPLTRAARAPAGAADVDDDDPFDGGVSAWTEESADRVIQGQLQAVMEAREGTVNSTLGGAARMLGRFVGGGYLAREKAEWLLLNAIGHNPVHSDEWNMRHGRKWTAASVIATGMAKGEMEPFEVVVPPAPEVTGNGAGGAPTPSAGDRSGAAGERSTTGQGSSGGADAPSAYPRLRVQSAAVMTYWLQQEIGQGQLAGFFARRGEVVHTPRVGELGYVPPAREGDDNGPAEIRPVGADVLAAKLQFLYGCFKDEAVKDPDTGKKTGEVREVPALFPVEAARRVVNAPEALAGLRTLRGVTHTPMVRADGSVLTQPGYDPATRYLFLPAPGVDVKQVPDDPGPENVCQARELLLHMVEDFPFATADDRANYLGLLITPLLRELAPPSYKMFGIGAHQPGSGKSLLAEIVSTIHGGVFRSEVPEDEPEWRKQTTSILNTTSAPVVVLDNVTGVLRSSTLAGLLTASGEIQDRELGTSRMLSAVNDRVWVVTGNNLSLGGDLVRRTITILIDPNMANPETRVDFAIPDLPRWVAENRNEILWSLLVLIRHWVASGRPAPARRQSDGFAAWEMAVGGILAAGGIQGAFDAESGKRAAAGGDDDGLAALLDHLRERFGDSSWSVAEALAPGAEAGTGFIIEGTHGDWLPGMVADKLERSPASGRITLGKWLRFRVGRWVTTAGGEALVLRDCGLEHKVQRWRVEQR